MERIKTEYKKVENVEQKGIEIYFDAIPTKEEREILKNKGFKWNNLKKCWYIKKEKLNNIKEKEINFEYLRIATTEEVDQIACMLWSSSDMQDYIKKSFDFYITKDGFILKIEKVKKISISKTMWYDDETEGPTKNEKNFIDYNMRLHNPARSLENYLEEAERLSKNGCATGLYDYKNIYLVGVRSDCEKIVACNWFDDKNEYFKRYLSDEEQKEYIKIMMNQKEEYLNRLKKYWKRYADYVHVCGYWANR